MANEIKIYDSEFEAKEIDEKLKKIQEPFTMEEKAKLGNLENYDDTEVKTTIAQKVSKESGKGLSSNDFTDADKAKLDEVVKAYQNQNKKYTLIEAITTNEEATEISRCQTPDGTDYHFSWLSIRLNQKAAVFAKQR